MLHGLKGVKNISDDIIVYGTSTEDHDENLRAVLTRIQEFNVILNKEKCRFSQPSVTFYGHVFGKNAITADANKISAVINASPPTSISEVCSFLGMAQYVSRFIPHFAKITAPLRKLTHQDMPWEWRDDQETAFRTLKSAITAAPTMTYFDPSKRSHVLVDASPAILM